MYTQATLSRAVILRARFALLLPQIVYTGIPANAAKPHLYIPTLRGAYYTKAETPNLNKEGSPWKTIAESKPSAVRSQAAATTNAAVNAIWKPSSFALRATAIPASKTKASAAPTAAKTEARVLAGEIAPALFLLFRMIIRNTAARRFASVPARICPKKTQIFKKFLTCFQLYFRFTFYNYT